MYGYICARNFCIIFIFVIINFFFVVQSPETSPNYQFIKINLKQLRKKKEKQSLSFNISNKRIKLKSLNHILKHYLNSLLSMGTMLVMSLLSTRDSGLYYTKSSIRSK